MENIINPKEIHPSLESFAKIYEKFMESEKLNDGIDRFEYHFTTKQSSIFKMEEFIDVIPHKYIFDIDYLKARCFDEANNLPYEMDKQTMQQAFFSLHFLKEKLNTQNLHDWLERIALNQKKKYY